VLHERHAPPAWRTHHRWRQSYGPSAPSASREISVLTLAGRHLSRAPRPSSWERLAPAPAESLWPSACAGVTAGFTANHAVRKRSQRSEARSVARAMLYSPALRSTRVEPAISPTARRSSSDTAGWGCTAHPSWRSCTAALTEFVAIRMRRPYSVCVTPVLMRAPLSAAQPVAHSARLPCQLRTSDCGCNVSLLRRRTQWGAPSG
jgi:hypothetical protein